jgi:hypothetical protein
MVGLAKLYPRCRQTKKKKLQKFTNFEKCKPLETPLGLLTMRKERKKWVIVTPTWEVDSLLVDAPNGL